MQHANHPKSIELVDRALAENPNQADWCRQLDIDRTTLSIARAKGRLTPMVAAELARLLGESSERWAYIALLEGEKPSRKVDKLRSVLRKIG